LTTGAFWFHLGAEGKAITSYHFIGIGGIGMSGLAELHTTSSASAASA
jgi:UDP-N-acetylmuramate-alanine ligase